MSFLVPISLLTILGLVSLSHFTFSELLQTSSGQVLASAKTWNGKQVNAYLGIPYAAPPVDKLRFAPPHEFTISDPAKVYGSSYSKSCVQFVTKEMEEAPDNTWIPKSTETSEDCLYLNIWTPSPKPVNATVMVWIHGGGFYAGTPAIDLYDGKYLAADENVIVVSMNYRLSILGFLYMGMSGSPGNVGLMDQASALKWVSRNIRLFGGDPKKVTIFGESAGGASVGHHMNIQCSQGLYLRAIVQSGSSTSPFATQTKDSAWKTTQRISVALKCSGNKNAMLECLRKKKITEIVAGVSKMNQPGMDLIFGPVVDGEYITNPKEVLKNKKFKKCDVLLGDTKDDGIVFALVSGIIGPTENSYIDSEKLYGFIDSLFSSSNESNVHKMIRYLYTDWEAPNEPVRLRQQLIDFTTDYWFRCSMNELADFAVVNTGHSVYRYRFSHRPSNSTLPEWTGAVHACEQSFVFGYATDLPKGKLTAAEAELSKQVMRHWSNFAKNGNPNVGNKVSVNWPRYNAGQREFLDIKLNSEVGRNLRVDHCSFWNQVFPDLDKGATKNAGHHVSHFSWLVITFLLLAFLK